MGWAGLEPAANALKGRCSTIELPTRSKRKVCNPLPTLLQGLEQNRFAKDFQFIQRADSARHDLLY
jgi:hypothetical protein